MHLFQQNELSRGEQHQRGGLQTHHRQAAPDQSGSFGSALTLAEIALSSGTSAVYWFPDYKRPNLQQRQGLGKDARERWCGRR